MNLKLLTHFHNQNHQISNISPTKATQEEISIKPCPIPLITKLEIN